ncbi:DUF6036 family nucleotidyltransferase [Duganella sp. Leaf126]|uniref:DUF6036 family nucleotidyltransferase n=1 Tax=Duganella sp. Leaf126 TaxID=1736266 RepID=UPI0012E28B4C|nr:DUF6036 family nucleotidyltransferase [Duganella sp. Leaf126]
MQREHIRIALNEASKLGPHKEFVVAGSLSVLGLKEVPPEMMSMSIDIDFFPFHDQSHIHDIAEALGEDSAFHEAHGYFLDPIAADVLVLPAGWMERMVLYEFGELRIYFLDVNDTAVSKYVRSADNDFRWIDAGLQSGLLDLDKIDARSQFGVDYPGDDDRRRIRNGIAAHRAAMKNSGSLRMELLEALRSRPEVRIATLIDDDYAYSGPVLFSLDDRVVQEVEHGVVVIHDSSGWKRLPEVGEISTITYRDGTALLEPGDL